MPSDIEKSIKKEYGLLNENEIRLCCLLFFKVPDRNIAKILTYKQKSIRSIKYIIKHKTGIQDIMEILKKIIVKDV
jgi:DNA-binding CsgD family transcriptional regulator